MTKELNAGSATALVQKEEELGHFAKIALEKNSNGKSVFGGRSLYPL